MAHRTISLLLTMLWLAISPCRLQKIKVRLQGGTQPYAGRVQVFHRGIWGGVCQNGWSKENAQVVCRQLRYKGVVLFTKGMFYGRQTGPTRLHRRIWLDQVKCNGDEYHIGQCRRNSWGRYRCNRERLAGVMCDPGIEVLTKQPPAAEATKHMNIKLFKIKLASEQTQGIINEGILKVRYGAGKWGAVCSDGWDMKDARVACGELGFTHAVETAPGGPSWRASGKTSYILTDVQCTGAEASLFSCNHSGMDNYSCKSGLPVSLKCKTNTPPFAHARLRGGVYTWEGRVEVRRRSNWATLCDKNLDIHTANVICRSLGYGTAYEYTLGTVFPHGTTGQKIYEEIDCTGNETFLQNCKWKLTKHKYPCWHYSDAGVKCNVPKRNTMNKWKVRLAGASRHSLGRVEVKIDGKWGVICGDRWTMKNAMVVCRELGLGYAHTNYSYMFYGRNGKTLVSGMTCLGNEVSLDQCLRHRLDNVSCSSSKSVAGVMCLKEAPDLLWDVEELTKTMRIDYILLGALECAYSENCLASTAAKFHTYFRWRHQRRLLRFSAKVHNVGTAAYRPYQAKNSWQWHSCHRHYHSDEEFALYDLITYNHVKVAEGHKASYCLEDTVCDPGVSKTFNCRNRGDQGISVNCHDNYDYTLDCQWVDITDLSYIPVRQYMLRLVANPSLKVAESDYTNNVALCKIADYGSYISKIQKCYLEICESGVRSHRGIGNFACCKFPFIYKGKSHNTCIEDEKTRAFWCSTTSNFDKDKLWGYC